jgi:ribosomal protein L16 Arg81 hydroxylase
MPCMQKKTNMEVVNFANLIAPVSIEDFFLTFWEKRFLHVKQGQPGYFSNILSPGDVDDFLSRQNLSADGIKLMKKGERIPAYEWTKQETLLDGTVINVVNNEKLFKLFDSGATIIINSAHKAIPNLADACSAFEQEMKIRVQANIYITPPHSQGFAMHYDPHDIFSMQIKGPKTWQIYDSGEELPTSNKAFKNKPELVSKFDIQAGDLLYMPRGIVHEAFSTNISTIHVNFSCKPRYGFHLLQDIAKLAEKEDIFFRHTIPMGLKSDADKKEYELTFKRKLHELIDSISPQQLIDRQYEDFVTNQLYNFGGSLLNLLKLEGLSLETTVSRRKGFTYLLKTVGKDSFIIFCGRKLSVPNFIEKDTLLQDKPFKVKDIKGLVTNNGKLTLVREFIEGGFLQIEEIE